MTYDSDVLASALSTLESQELGLLAWGLTDGALTSDEVDDTLLDFIASQDHHISLGQLTEQLIERGLLLAPSP